MSDAGAKYRPEIDGLRAIAIVAVVAYHVGVPAAPGGFVGVDVFFVISGFLITGLLLDEYRSHGSIDLLAFYARRVRRLLPAFVIVVLTTLLLGLYFLLPVREEQSNLARSAIHAAVYASNVFFARHSGGYFDGPADLLPLLHTWSLSVEEQFYLAYHASKDFNSARRCHQHPPFAGLRPREECTVSEGGQKRFVLLWGDSHADHIMPLLEAAMLDTGVSVIQRSMSGCLPVMEVIPVRACKPFHDCAKFNEAVLGELRSLHRQGLVGVVLSARWSMYQGRSTLSNSRGHELRYIAATSQQDSIAIMENRVRGIVTLLTDIGLNVGLIAPIPEQRYRAPSCLSRSDVERCSISRRDAEANRTGAYDALERAIALVPGSRLIDLFPALCDDYQCPAERNGTILYRDDDHLTASGARSLAPWFAETALWLAEPSREAAARGG